MKTSLCILALLATVLALGACASTDKKKPARPDVVPVRTSFDRIEQLTGDLEAQMKKEHSR